MEWLVASRAAKAAVIALMLASCGAACGSDPPAQVNRPLAQADVTRPLELARVEEIVRAFARKNGFAAQEAMIHSQGMLEFDMRLFRDDISISISKLRNNPIGLAAYPLCVCELGRRVGLRAAADASIRELREDLSRQ